MFPGNRQEEIRLKFIYKVISLPKLKKKDIQTRKKDCQIFR